MPEQQIDSQLIPWSEIAGELWQSLLLGNGFSMNIWPKFGYKSLYEVAKSDEVEPSLDANSTALFERLGSNNFEDVLRVLFHARLVDVQLDSPQQAQIDALYNSTKNALAAAVNYSHVPHGFNSLTAINISFRSFRNIFTTNYDLIPYWAIMQEEVGRFKDLFWGKGNTFDPSNTEVNADRCVISYLHGAIHLVELPDGKTKKLTANGINSLAELFDLDHPEYFPLFISEGSSERKLSRIKRNDYLRFSFEKLQSIDGNIVVIGHSLHKDYDQHLLNALRDGNVTSIAIGVWPLQGPEEILLFKSRVLAEIKGKNIYFFDSTTHPLGNSGLKHEA
ncbi:DUF4917 family protein [Polaromonas sp. SM01]|uniref:DUF4917 family protein n=1 Tax=Polaromonas sp. SM01 TaxID=3085630 RepID=UPI002980E506|nr:DUF4917 family protein [Polaromonas sp. SM01]MDW5444453.1 DUF4917 family protein [Polaromonas sp. SM01]